MAACAISTVQALQAFTAAEAASAATKAVLSSTPATTLAARIAASDSNTTHCDRITAVHRLNERFAACGSYSEAVELAAELLRSTNRLCDALVEMLVEGDVLIELSVQLLHSLSLHDDGAIAVVRAGAAPVLAAALRADDALMRAHGLALLATLAERPALAVPLVKAGVVKLLCFLGRAASADAASAAQLWPPLLETTDSLLRDPRAVPERQRMQLRDVFVSAARMHKAGSLPLMLTDARTLNRLMMVLRALSGVRRPVTSGKA